MLTEEKNKNFRSFHVNIYTTTGIPQPLVTADCSTYVVTVVYTLWQNKHVARLSRGKDMGKDINCTRMCIIF